MTESPVMLPSDMARLVYGYLESCKCPTVAKGLLDTSPHMEECRKRVAEVGRADFLTKPFWLSLEEILELYIDISDLVFSQLSLIFPDIKKKFTNPAEALKFLLSLGEQPTPTNHNLDNSSSDRSRRNSVCDRETCSNFSLQIGLSPDRESKNSDGNVSDIRDIEEKEVKEHMKESSQFSIENFIQVPRKRLKMFKSRIHPVKNEHETKEVEKKQIDLPGSPNLANKDSISSLSSSFPEVFKTLMHKKSFYAAYKSESEVHTELRRSSRNKNNSVPLVPELECEKEKRRKHANDDKENDTRFDFSRIPEILMNDSKWPELIAENINKGMCESPKKRKSNIFGSIAEKTLDDQSCDELIREIFSDVLPENPVNSKEDDRGTETQIDNYLQTTEMVHQVSGNIDMADPIYNIHEQSNNLKLQEDMSEFIQFNNNSNNIIDENSSVIILDAPYIDQENLMTVGDFIVNKNQTLSPIISSNVNNNLEQQNIQWFTNENMSNSGTLSTFVACNSLDKPLNHNKGYRLIAPKGGVIKESSPKVQHPSKSSSRKNIVNNSTVQTRSFQRSRR